MIGPMQSTFIEHTLPNGLRVVCEVMPRVRSAAAGFFVRTGSRHERPHEHGVSHFLEHMCFKGTPRRSWHDINVRFDELGSIYNAYTSKERTVYYGWVPAARIEPQIELLADMMRPSLPPDDFETERNVILEEIAMSGDSFEHFVWNALHEVCFGDHPLAHEVLGEQETIAKLPREVMVEYHRRRYTPDNMVLVVAGGIDPDEVFAAAGRYCGHWNRDTVAEGAVCDPPPPPTGQHVRTSDRFAQQSLVLAYPAVPEGHRLTETIEVFQAAFGGRNSRCFWNIVQKGICAAAGALWLAYRDTGLMVLYADGEPDRCEAMLDALRAQAREVGERGFADEEVRRVKNRRRTHLALEAENPRTRLMQLMDDLEAGGYARSADARLAAVEAVRSTGISGYLDRYPITGEGVLISCGPRRWPERCAETSAVAGSVVL